ncbi:hypothetical protein OC844_007611 [Tilletia horrida]|nr:hypothetical protein OC844_007611 [Tilletia horrida]
MMRDRVASDPDVVVTGAGERRTVEDDDDDADYAEEDELDDGERSVFSQARHARGTEALYDDEYGYNDDDLDSVDSPALLNRSRTSMSPEVSLRHMPAGPASMASRRSSGINLRAQGSASSLPSLSALAEQSTRDHQSLGAVTAASSRPSSTRDRSPTRSAAGSRSASNQASSSKGKGRSRPADEYVAEFKRAVDEDRALQHDREETKRRKLDFRAQQMQLLSQERERQSDIVNIHYNTLVGRMDALQMSINARMDGIQGVLTGLMAKMETLGAKLDAISSKST